MSTDQPKRHARLEIVEADITDVFPVVKSKRPHFLRLVAGNGQILAHTENYANLTNARRAAPALVRAFLQVGFAEANGRVQVVEVTA